MVRPIFFQLTAYRNKIIDFVYENGGGSYSPFVLFGMDSNRDIYKQVARIYFGTNSLEWKQAELRNIAAGISNAISGFPCS